MTSPSPTIPSRQADTRSAQGLPEPFDRMCFQHTPSFIVQGSRQFHVTGSGAQKSSYIKSPLQGFHPSPVAQRGQP